MTTILTTISMKAKSFMGDLTKEILAPQTFKTKQGKLIIRITLGCMGGICFLILYQILTLGTI